MRHATFEANPKFEIKENTMDRPPNSEARGVVFALLFSSAILCGSDLVTLVARLFDRMAWLGSLMAIRWVWRPC